MSQTLTLFQEAKAAAEQARNALVAREAELRAELAEIRSLLGRKPRAPKATTASKKPVRAA